MNKVGICFLSIYLTTIITLVGFLAYHKKNFAYSAAWIEYNNCINDTVVNIGKSIDEHVDCHNNGVRKMNSILKPKIIYPFSQSWIR